jgi:hypothetical protein
MASMARRLAGAATAIMPASRRDWGRAIAAELEHASSRGDQARLVLAATRVALLPPPGLADWSRVAVHSACLTAVAYLPLGVALYLVNAVFRVTRESTPGVLAMDAYLLVTLMAAGALARRASASRLLPVMAGITAGLVIATLELGTWALIGKAAPAGILIACSVAGATFAPIGAALSREIIQAWSHARRITRG